MKSDRYGFIMEPEAELVDWIIDDLHERFKVILFLEVGVFGGGTATGIYNRCKELNYPVHGAGVDFDYQCPSPKPAEDYSVYAGDSMDQWRKIHEPFNFLFVDGCHCVNHVMCDFLNYSPFVFTGGFCLFHDTDQEQGKEYQGGWPQDHSYAGKPDSVIGVREGLKKLGLMDHLRMDWKFVKEVKNRDDGTAGMMLFQKIL